MIGKYIQNELALQMFKIKRIRTHTTRSSKKLPYFRLSDDVTSRPQDGQRMPDIATAQTYKAERRNIDQQLTMDNLLYPNLPMLAKPEDPANISDFSAYIYEEKFDGERMLAIVIDSSTKRCFTRTLKISNIFKNAIKLQPGYHHCIFDGELVYLDDVKNIIPICDTGFKNALQIQYMIFDVQMVNGENVMHKPLLERKELLTRCLVEYDLVRVSKYTRCTTEQETMSIFTQVCDRGGEGLMLKCISESYVPNRRLWFKLKKLHLKYNRDEFDLYAYKFNLDKNGVRNILDCGYFDDNGSYVHISHVSSGINNEKRNKLKLMSCPQTGLLYNRTIVTIIADKVTIGKKSLRHPSLYRIRNDIDEIDISRFL